MSKSPVILKIYVALVMALVTFPLFIVIPMSLSQGQFLKFPPMDIGFRWYKAYLNDEQWIRATIVSLRVAIASSIVATVIGTIAALAIDRSPKRLEAPFATVLSLPIVLPHIFIALGVFVLALKFDLVDSEVLLVIAHATMALPFVVLMVGAVVRQLDVSIERAARMLGAGPIRTFFAAVFPPLAPSIVAAAVVAFFASFDELAIALFLMGGKETLPMKLWANMRLDVSPVIAAVASLLIVVTTAGMFLAESLRQRGMSNTKA